MRGVLLLDKPGGYSSSQVLNIVKKNLNIKKAGYIGTLDPMATGLLPLCIGAATKIIPYIDDQFKEYIGEMKLGKVTDTLDKTGRVVKEYQVGKLKIDDILQAFDRYRGEVTQTPPMFSAVKQGGVRLYALARRGIEVERKERKVIIERFDLIDFKDASIRFFVRCSKGTYIRSLCHDIGMYLSCGAYLSELRRVKVGMFTIEDAYTLEEIKEGRYTLIDEDEALGHMEAIEVDGLLAEKVKHGKKILKTDISPLKYGSFKKGELVKLLCGGRLISVVEALVSSYQLEEEDNWKEIFKIKRVFN